MPKPSLSRTCTTGARQLVVQLALEMMWCLAGVVLLVVDAHDDGDVLALGRGGDDDLLRPGRRCAPGLLASVNRPVDFDHVFDARAPSTAARPGLP